MEFVAAQTALEVAGERQAKIDELKAEAQMKLDEITSNQEQGRPRTEVSARKAALSAKITRLERGFLPSEVEGAFTKKSKEQLTADAHGNALHHGAPSQLTSPGRPANAPQLSGAAAAAGGGARDGSGVAGEGNRGGCDGDSNGDDGDEDPAFKQYVTVGSSQKAFNERAVRGYLKHGGDSACIHHRQVSSALE